MITDAVEVQNLRDAYRKIRGLEAAAVERGQMYLSLMGKDAHYNPEYFTNEHGYRVKADLDSLLDEQVDFVIFFARDEQGGGNWKTVTIPRAFIFGDLSDEDKERAEYLRLKAKYEGK